MYGTVYSLLPQTGSKPVALRHAFSTVRGFRLRPTPSQGPWGWGWPGARWACTLQPGCHYNHTTRYLYLYLFVVSTSRHGLILQRNWNITPQPAIHESQAEEQDIPERRRAPPPC